MKIVVTGTRGIPSIQGVETHFRRAFALYQWAAMLSCCAGLLMSRKDSANGVRGFQGGRTVDHRPLPRRKSFEACPHCAPLSRRKARRPTLCIYGAGGFCCLLVPVAKMLGLKVSDNHGPDYERGNRKILPTVRAFQRSTDDDLPTPRPRKSF